MIRAMKPWLFRVYTVLGLSSQDLDTWLITMVIISPLRIGLFPFQMAIHGLKMGVIRSPLTTVTGMIHYNVIICDYNKQLIIRRSLLNKHFSQGSLNAAHLPSN